MTHQEDVTPGKELSEMDNFVVKAVIADYRRLILKAINKEIRGLDAKFTDGRTVLARRNALVDVLRLVDEISYDKRWVRDSMTAIRTLGENTDEC